MNRAEKAARIRAIPEEVYPVTPALFARADTPMRKAELAVVGLRLLVALGFRED